ncbi:MAG: HAD-IB family phosphatase [Thermoplasmataceae archaeon]
MALSDFDLFVFDMDGVLTLDSSSWNYVHRRFSVDNSNLRQRFEDGKITYADFLKGDVKLWIEKRGRVSKEEVISILMEIPMTGGMVQAISSLKSEGKKVAIVSGGISWLADIVQSNVKFDHVNSNHIFTDKNGFLVPDGKIEVDFKRKDLNVRELRKKYSVPRERTVCIGDSLDDRSMFREAGYSIAFNPRHEDLSGYADTQVKSADLRDVVSAVRRL